MKRNKNYLGWDFKRKREKDKICKKDRSSLMSKIKSQGTKFENDFIKILKKKTKKRFIKNAKGIMGKPDIVFKKAKVCIFLDSDFWHGWQFPRWKHLLKNNYWKEKIDRNRKRDKKVTAYLRRNGWIVVRLWGHDMKKERIDRKIKTIINSL